MYAKYSRNRTLNSKTQRNYYYSFVSTKAEIDLHKYSETEYLLNCFCFYFVCYLSHNTFEKDLSTSDTSTSNSITIMISEKTFKIIKFMLSVNNYLHNLPLEWDEERRLLKPLSTVRHYRMFSVIGWCQVMNRLVMFAYFGITIAVFDIPMYQTMVALFMCTVWSLTNLMRFAVKSKTCEEMFEGLMNAVLIYNQRQSKTNTLFITFSKFSRL